MSDPRLSDPRVTPAPDPVVTRPSAPGPGTSAAPEQPAPAAPQDPEKRSRLKRKARRAAARIGIALTAAALFIAAMFGVLWLLDRRSVPVFPDDDVATLPESTIFVQRFRGDRLPIFSEPKAPAEHEEALWAHYSQHLCGTDDVFEALMNSRTGPGRSRAARALDDRHGIAEGLACGRDLRKKVGRGAHVVRFSLPEEPDADKKRRAEPTDLERKDKDKDEKDKPKDGEEPSKERPKTPPWRQIVMLEVFLDALPNLPSHFVRWRDKGGLTSTYCTPRSDRKDADCSGTSRAVARLDQTHWWVSGTLRDIQRFGRLYSPEGKNDLANAQLLTDIGARVRSMPLASVGSWESFEAEDVLWSLGLPPSADMKNLAVGGGKLEYSVYKARAAWAYGERSLEGGDEVQLFFLTEHEGDATDLAVDLKEWLTGLKEEFAGATRSPDESPEDQELKKVDREYAAAKRAVAIRAIRHAEIEREDKLVIVTFTKEPNNDELQAFEEMDKEASDRAKLVASIVRNLAEGGRPDEDLLREVGGRKLVDAVQHTGSGLERDERAP